MGLPAGERDSRKCQLYNKIYELNKENNREFIDSAGRPTVEYWSAARKIVETKMREWADGKDPFEGEDTFLLRH